MDYRKHAFIMAMISSLRANGSPTGKTHIQKATFLLNETTPVDAPFVFCPL